MFVLSFLLLGLSLSLAIWIFYKLISAGFNPISRRREPPFVPTPNSLLTVISQLAALKDTDVFCDLGSGNGRVTFFLARHSGAQGIGLEKSWLLYLYSSLKAKFRRLPVKFLHCNLEARTLRDYDVVFAYLGPALMARLESKLSTEMKTGSRLISVSFPLQNRQAEIIKTVKVNRFETITVYFYKY